VAAARALGHHRSAARSRDARVPAAMPSDAGCGGERWGAVHRCASRRADRHLQLARRVARSRGSAPTVRADRRPRRPPRPGAGPCPARAQSWPGSCSRPALLRLPQQPRTQGPPARPRPGRPSATPSPSTSQPDFSDQRPDSVPALPCGAAARPDHVDFRIRWLRHASVFEEAAGPTSLAGLPQARHRRGFISIPSHSMVPHSTAAHSMASHSINSSQARWSAPHGWNH
jgi:hypothetical protein